LFFSVSLVYFTVYPLLKFQFSGAFAWRGERYVVSSQTITCPSCKTAFKLDESLAAPLLAATRTEFERKLAEKDGDVARREAALQAQRVELARQQSSLEEQVATKIATERTRIVAEEGKKARLLLENDLTQKSNELANLAEVLKARDLKLAEAQQAQADFLKKQRELDDAKRELDVTVEKRVQDSLVIVRDKAKLEAEGALRLKVTEKETQIASMQRQIEELKRRAEQGSQQLQGEAQEIELEALLRAKFPHDSIEPVGKGEFGGDIIQRVTTTSGQECGTILWESKRTKNWVDGWLPKLRDNQRAAKADIALLISHALPKGMNTLDLVEGVWVAEVQCAIPVAIALRQSLIELAAARKSADGQQTKTEMVYQYLTGPRFRHRVEAIVERFRAMKDDLEKERTMMTKQWAKRETHIRIVIEATAGMYGDLQGIAGSALAEIDSLDAPMLEAPSQSALGGAET